jgi:hypothetical protein
MAKAPRAKRSSKSAPEAELEAIINKVIAGASNQSEPVQTDAMATAPAPKAPRRKSSKAAKTEAAKALAPADDVSPVLPAAELELRKQPPRETATSSLVLPAAELLTAAPTMVSGRLAPKSPISNENQATPRQNHAVKAPLLGSRRLERVSAFFATVLVAATCGAVAGSLATVEIGRALGPDTHAAVSINRELMQRVGRLQGELVTLKADFNQLARHSGATDTPRLTTMVSDNVEASPAVETTGSVGSENALPSDAPVVEGWVLRNVRDGSALVEGRPGLIEVMPGDSLPGGGRIETIKHEGGRWVVVTTSGLIVSR